MKKNVSIYRRYTRDVNRKLTFSCRPGWLWVDEAKQIDGGKINVECMRAVVFVGSREDELGERRLG